MANADTIDSSTQSTPSGASVGEQKLKAESKLSSILRAHIEASAKPKPQIIELGSSPSSD